MAITVDAVYENGVLKPSEPLPLKEHDRVRVTVQDPLPTDTQPRPYGLCAGEFTVPDDFNQPLPDEILREFEGRVH